MPIDAKAVVTWNRASHAYQHYVEYINSKQDQFALTFTDLTYVKNFKGGSAIIGEPVAMAGPKLAHYEATLRAYSTAPEFQLPLHKLDEQAYAKAKRQMERFVNLVNQGPTDISGFGESFASALLHFYFPTLVPILDRRALNGAGIRGLNVNAQNQVTNLLALYPFLIDHFRRRLCANPSSTIRTIDRELFVKPLRIPPFRKKK